MTCKIEKNTDPAFYVGFPIGRSQELFLSCKDSIFRRLLGAPTMLRVVAETNSYTTTVHCTEYRDGEAIHNSSQIVSPEGKSVKVRLAKESIKISHAAARKAS